MRMIFVNLPVKDLERSKRFFGDLGFTFNPAYSDETAACMVISDCIFAMLITEQKFRGFVTGEISDAFKATEVLTALSVDTRDAVDTILEKALAGGARPWKPVQDHGFMYGCSFQDLDGHVWEFLWMAPQTP